ncbi:MAG: hypothetical protein HDS21_06960 [Bacteroides sp.]|nr:hypothetical protein [Bacteroides sp.]
MNRLISSIAFATLSISSAMASGAGLTLSTDLPASEPLTAPSVEALAASIGAVATDTTASTADLGIVKGRVHRPEMDEKVIVGKDTVNLVLEDRNFGRYDRGLFNYLFIPAKQWSFGLMASYGQFNADDMEILQAVKNFDFDVKQYAIRPTVSYFFRHNQCVGLKFDYTRAEIDLGSLEFNFLDDLSFDIHDISYYSSKYSIGVFYRNYVGFGREKRFAVFNEACLSFGSGSSRFKRPFDGKIRDTRTDLTEVALNFSPGVCMFIMENLSFNVSFGVFGVHLRNEKQVTDGVEEGSRFSSGANFKFNLFNINFGIGVHI